MSDFLAEYEDEDFVEEMRIFEEKSVWKICCCKLWFGDWWGRTRNNEGMF